MSLHETEREDVAYALGTARFQKLLAEENGNKEDAEAWAETVARLEEKYVSLGGKL